MTGWQEWVIGAGTTAFLGACSWLFVTVIKLRSDVDVAHDRLRDLNPAWKSSRLKMRRL